MQLSDQAVEGLIRFNESYTPIIPWRGGEFFPGVSKSDWDHSVGFARDMRRTLYRNERNSNPDCIKMREVPPEIIRRTVAAAGGNYGIWRDELGGERVKWWNQVVSGSRDSFWTPNGPGCTAGMWVA